MVSKGDDKLDRREKVKSRTSRTHAVRESYNPIVPLRQANEDPQARDQRAHRSEESGQERGLAKGKVVESPTTGTQSPGKKFRADWTAYGKQLSETGSCSLQRCCTTSPNNGWQTASGD